MKIAIDAMGGDHGLKVIIPAVCQVLDEYQQLELVLVGDSSQISEALKQHNCNFNDRIHVRHASEVVSMHDLPSHAVRTKKDSSMRVAINLVKSSEVAACVSAGNTGALMATAKFVLKTIEGIDRPAIIASVPTENGNCYILDLGANIVCDYTNLYQFALLGGLLYKKVNSVKQPTVGLLNIGEEDIKGRNEIRLAARELLLHSEVLQNSFKYIGFIEGNDIFKGKADVIVCDGFAGNVLLKTSEGISRFIMGLLKAEFSKSWYRKLLALLSWPVFRYIKKRLDPRDYNGAIFIGLKGIVIKSHGSADSHAFASAIRAAVREAELNIPLFLEKELEKIRYHAQ